MLLFAGVLKEVLHEKGCPGSEFTVKAQIRRQDVDVDVDLVGSSGKTLSEVGCKYVLACNSGKIPKQQRSPLELSDINCSGPYGGRRKVLSNLRDGGDENRSQPLDLSHVYNILFSALHMCT